MLSLRKRIEKLSYNIQEAIVADVLDVLPGTEFVSKDIQAERLNHCENCENMNSENRKCNLCGCFIDQKIRVLSLPFTGKEHCPQNKW